MIRADEIWGLLVRYMPLGVWMDLEEVYGLVRDHGYLDHDDERPQAPGSLVPKWKRNVRNVLQRRKGLGHVDWDGKARYRPVRGHAR